MASVNNSTDVQGKPAPNLAFALPGSNGGITDSDNLADGLFASMLTQNQAPPPANNQQTSTQPQSSPGNGTANGANYDSNANNSSNSNSSNVPAVNPNWLASGKISHLHDKKKSGNKDTGNDGSNNVAANKPSSTSNNNPVAGTAGITASNTKNNPPNTSASNPANADNSGSPASATDSTPVSGPAGSDPTANTAKTDPNISSDLFSPVSTSSAAGTNSTPSNLDALLNAALNAASGIADGTNTGQQPVTPGEFAADIVTMLTAATTVNANSGATDATGAALAANDATAAGNTDPTQPSSTDNKTGDLLALLVELEQLAASQAATAPIITNANANTGENSSAVAGSDPQSKIDLKALLAAVASLTDGGDNTNTGLAALNTSNGTTVSSPTSNPTPAGAPASGNGSSSNTNNDLLSPAFLNLFGVPANTNPPAALPVFNPGVVANAMITNDGGASLGSDMQGQGNADTHSTAAGLPLDANSLMPSATPTQAANPYNFASQLSAMRATQGGATGLPTPVDQVILQLSRGLSKDGSSQMTIQLKPAELGRVDVKLNIGSDGKVQGSVTADHPATLSLLLKDVRGLERALQEAGLRADSGSLQFSLRGDGQAGNGFSQTANNQSGFAGTGNFSDTSTILPAYTDTIETYYLTPGGVNMRV